jgi:hypothetical protein
MPLDKL